MDLSWSFDRVYDIKNVFDIYFAAEAPLQRRAVRINIL